MILKIMRICVLLEPEKIKRISDAIPNQKIFGMEDMELLVVGWGGTYGSLYSIVDNLIKEGQNMLSLSV